MRINGGVRENGVNERKVKEYFKKYTGNIIHLNRSSFFK